MVLAVRDRVDFYTSSDLKEWSFASDFGSDIPGIHRGIFECPEVFKIQVDEDPNITKWVLMLSVGDRNGVNPNDSEPPAGGSGMMYFIGNFDGKVFTRDETLESFDTIKWIDYGSDFYAAVTWDGIPKEDGRKIWVGWMNNWRYASTLPSKEWRGHMSIPESFSLRHIRKEFA
uniref:Glycosyl hydrolase family 32 N-terminal domain-containing protein n=1 Tax=Paenibacillus polymyxa TaxID=1406 RepID=A0AAE9PR48_PAEPO